MILGPIAYLDCLIYVLFLIPQLLIHVNILELLRCFLQAIPYLLIQTPIFLIRERVFTAHAKRTPFVQRAPLFQDLVIRCVRYAFANFPASIGRVFFSKPVALPFMRFRMLRHGYFKSPMTYTEINDTARGFRGVWVVADPSRPVDLVVYYLHGGGFSMGSSYFYLEFLMAWIELLRTECAGGGVRNPAVFALEYSLVPDKTFPVQVNEVRAGYEWALNQLESKDGKRVCVAGDSAGATLVLSLLLVIAGEGEEHTDLPKPGFATLLSPWCVLVSDRNHDTPSDYLNADMLHTYARQYVCDVPPTSSDNANGKRKSHLHSKIASPGLVTSSDLWGRASPTHGFHFIYGSEEVFAPDARALIQCVKGATRQQKSQDGGVAPHVETTVTEEEGGIHAWPVVDLFLKGPREQRLKGLTRIVEVMKHAMGLEPDKPLLKVTERYPNQGKVGSLGFDMGEACLSEQLVCYKGIDH